VRIEGIGRTWQADDLKTLEDAFDWRDHRGGAYFWLTHNQQYPTLAVRISGDFADVCYFPHDGHPGFRCIGDGGMTDNGSTKLVFDGCDPESGEDTPNVFIVPVRTARSIASEFLRNKQMSNDVS
jgi:hypothetical protein